MSGMRMGRVARRAAARKASWEVEVAARAASRRASIRQASTLRKEKLR